MNIQIHESWLQQLQQEFQHDYFKKLELFVSEEYTNYQCYPQAKDIFAAFNQCAFEATKVVILGQDPYHGPEQANGLSFSVQDGIKHPPSLVNIFKEIGGDLGIEYPESGNLQRWANQGVLLLNATLTVRAHEAGSHQKMGWEQFTDAVIRKLSDTKTGVIFMLWGAYAKKKKDLIATDKHHVLTSGHPSPLSANRGYWFGNGHFSQANALLRDEGKQAIVW